LAACHESRDQNISVLREVVKLHTFGLIFSINFLLYSSSSDWSFRYIGEVIRNFVVLVLGFFLSDSICIRDYPDLSSSWK